MKAVSLWALSLLCLFLTSTASADYSVQGTVTEIQINAYGNAGDKIVVWGTFVTGCTYNAFSLGPNDSFFKQSYATFLAAKVTGTPIKVFISYCDPSGLARANGYALISN